MIAILLSLFASPDSWPASSNPRIDRVPEGTIERGEYRNGAFEISFQIQDSWTAVVISAGAAPFAPERTADDPVNWCSRALFSTQPSGAGDKPFDPKVTYYVFDPECFTGPAFPRSAKDRTAVAKFARLVIRAFALTPFIPPSGADFGAFNAGRRAFVTLAAEKNVHGPLPEDTVHVNMLLTITESNGYWIISAQTVDDASKRIMQAGHIGVSERR